MGSWGRDRDQWLGRHAGRGRRRGLSGTVVIDGVALAPLEKTIQNGKEMAAYRTEATVAAIEKSMAANAVR